MKPQSTKWLRILPLLALLALAAAPARALELDETFEQTYPLAAGGSVTLVNVNGSVRVEGWEKNSVAVYAVKRALREPRDLQRVSIAVEAAPGRVSIKTQYPANDPAGVEVEYRIKVPYQVALSRVETVNGNVLIRGVEGTGELRTVNGNVDVFDSAGGFSGRATNGNVHVELQRLAGAGEMSLESINGSVMLAVPPGAGAALDVRSLNGEFRTELPIYTPSSAGREFRGQLGRGGITVRLRTVNGGIEIVTLRATI